MDDSWKDEGYEQDERAEAMIARAEENAHEEEKLAQMDLAAQTVLDSDNEAIREVLAEWKRMFGSVSIANDCLPFGLLCYRAGRLRERRP